MTNLAIKLETIQFHNQSLIVLNHKNKPYVAMKPICENIGLDWAAQLKRIKRHQVLSKGMVIMTTPSKGGEQEYVCLPISMINGWLFGIDTNRVKPEIRSTLEQYQLECFDVLYNHFMPKVAKEYPNTINLEQQQAIKQAVNQRSYRTGEHYQAVYSKLYAHFKIPRYQDLPSSKFDDAIKWLGGLTSHKNHEDLITVNKTNLICLVTHMQWLFNFYKERNLYTVFKMLGSDYGVKMHDHLLDGATVSYTFKRQLEELNALPKNN